MTFGFNIEEAEVAPGTLGLLYDRHPSADHSGREALRMGHPLVPRSSG
jgi:hypothetical protein